MPAPVGDPEAPLQFQVSALDYSNYLGRLAIGRIRRGRIAPGQEVAVLNGPLAEGQVPPKAKIGQVLAFAGLERVPVDAAEAGDIVLVTGVDDLTIGTTLASVETPEALPPISVDLPTLSMYFQVNTSPLAGREGKYVTSRNLRDRLAKEILTNVALRVEETGDTDAFLVSGRGELHLTILIENMRREGYELAVSRPRVVLREIDGVTCEPYEALSVDVEEAHQGAVMEALGPRRGELTNMESDGRGRARLEYRIPARGLIGFQGEFMNLTRGTGLMSHVFDGYAPVKGDIPERRNGVLISAEDGEAVAYALWKLQERGRMFVSPGDKLYEGMVIGIHSRDNDLVVNPIKGKQLTNVRASGTDEAVRARAADRADARIRGRVHRRRRAGRGDAAIDPHPQALPQGTRAQEGEPRGGVTLRRGHRVERVVARFGPRRALRGPIRRSFTSTASTFRGRGIGWRRSRSSRSGRAH